MKLLLLTTFILIFIASAVYADMQSAIDALNSKNYKQAFQEFMIEAKKGNAAAQNSLGNLYANGLGVKRNRKRALYWYKKSAKQGNSDGICSLGNAYLHGIGTKKDSTKATEYFERSAKMDNPLAQYDLAKVLYKTEEIIPLDLDKEAAAGWMQKAANNNLPQAQYKLGLMYFKGIVLGKDVKKAYFWEYIASKNGYKPALEKLKLFEKNLSAEEQKEEIANAEEWLKLVN